VADLVGLEQVGDTLGETLHSVLLLLHENRQVQADVIDFQQTKNVIYIE
jgi:hypothetical protein